MERDTGKKKQRDQQHIGNTKSNRKQGFKINQRWCRVSNLGWYTTHKDINTKQLNSPDF